MSFKRQRQGSAKAPGRGCSGLKSAKPTFLSGWLPIRQVSGRSRVAVLAWISGWPWTEPCRADTARNDIPTGLGRSRPRTGRQRRLRLSHRLLSVGPVAPPVPAACALHLHRHPARPSRSDPCLQLHALSRKQLHQPCNDRMQQRVEPVIVRGARFDEVRRTAAAPVHAVQHRRLPPLARNSVGTPRVAQFSVGANRLALRHDPNRAAAAQQALQRARFRG
jgi:hypothetical protein